MSRPKPSRSTAIDATVPTAQMRRYFSAAMLLITAAPTKRASMKMPSPTVRIVDAVADSIQPSPVR